MISALSFTEGMNDRKCFPKTGVVTSEEQVKSDDLGMNSKTRTVIYISAGVGIVWIIIVIIICLYVKYTYRIYNVLSYFLKLTAARLKKGTAQ